MPAPDPAAPPVTLRGSVERVTFHNEETGYAILKVLPDGKSDVVTVIGKAPRIVAGERVTAVGTWESNRDFGKQLRSTSLQLAPPDSQQGIVKYLGSGLIEGIGEQYAERLVERFGEKVFDIIENESARLEGVEGIGKKRRLLIRESWMKQKGVHAVMLFLHQHGVSTARAQRIFKTYGADAVALVRKDPYCLARDIHGIGFKTADEIAHKMGIANDAAERIRAGLAHTLETASQSGHCCLPRAELIAHAAKLLTVEPAQIEVQVEALLAASQLTLHAEMIYLPWLRGAEVGIVRGLRALLHGPPSYPAMDIDTAITWAEQKTQRELAPGQRAAVKLALTQRALIITGGPGVGKTTVLNAILSILQSKAVNVVLAAPTGRAAKRMTESTGIEAKTLHRLLEFQGDGQWGRHRGNPLVGHLFVVDECSMIDAPLMAQFMGALPDGAHLLLVGDADQLPSVGPGMVLGDLIASGVVPCARLTEIFRQAAGSRIITSAHEINRGHVPDLKPQRDADFFFLTETDPEKLRELIVQLVRDRLPAKYRFDPARDIQVLTPMNRHALGTHALNQALQSALNPPNPMKFEIERFGLTFRVGDKVIQTQNNYEKEVFNGDIGFITGIDTEPVKVRVRFDSRVISYEPGELDELQLAYALTVHKSQGSEFPCVVIPASTQHYVLLERSLIYTAVTRGRRLVVICGDEKALRIAVQKQETRQRHTGLRAELASIPTAVFAP